MRKIRKNQFTSRAFGGFLLANPNANVFYISDEKSFDNDTLCAKKEEKHLMSTILMQFPLSLQVGNRELIR